MSSNPDDLKMLKKMYKSMDIEELKANIDSSEENIDFSSQIPCLDIAKNELEKKYKERQEQLDMLTRSLTSSSRLDRWISSIRAILN